jgi:hypothetical protein
VSANFQVIGRNAAKIQKSQSRVTQGSSHAKKSKFYGKDNSIANNAEKNEKRSVSHTSTFKREQINQ